MHRVSSAFQQQSEISLSSKQVKEKPPTHRSKKLSKISKCLSEPQEIPPIADLIHGVYEYTGTLGSKDPILTHFQMASALDIPIVWSAVLQNFPDRDLQVPPYLDHPIQMLEVKDMTVEDKEKEGHNNRPRTPLWKTFRWKAWAQKRGIVPSN